MRRHNILFASPEIKPFAWSGGLGEVASSLPRCIDKTKFDVRTIMPLYASIDECYKCDMVIVAELDINLGWRRKDCTLYMLNFNGHIHYFIGNDYYFNRENVYGYDDDFERAAFFSRAVLEVISHMCDFIPDIIHCNEWYTALIPVFHKERFCNNPTYRNIRSILSLHNIGFQGVVDTWVIEDLLELSGPDVERGLIHDGKVNYLHAGILYANKVTVVSPTYAKEVLTEGFGAGLEDLFNENPPLGILNGIDYDEYNPQTDPHIAVTYGTDSIERKVENKLALQSLLGLPQNPRSIFLLSLSRLARYQKGIEMIIDVIPDFMDENVQVLILGSGERDFVEKFKEYEASYPDKVRYREFDLELQQLALAGSDVLLMPSMYEPCGLSQIMAMRYGTIPLVRSVGGLNDTVVPYRVGGTDCRGFSFLEKTSDGLAETLKEAIKVYQVQQRYWKSMIYNCMTADFSWNNSAYIYGLAYSNLIFERKMPFVYHNTFDLQFRSVPDICCPGQTIWLSILAPGVNFVTLRLWINDSEEVLIDMDWEGDWFMSDIVVPDTPGIVWYYFIIHADDNTFYYGRESEQYEGNGTLTMTEPHSFQITVGTSHQMPEWYMNGIIYQIFPDRFNRGADWRSRIDAYLKKDSDKFIESRVVEDWYEKPKSRKRVEMPSTWDFYGGTLEGIIDKIPYLKSLGVTILYLNPIFKSLSYHRYDTVDYSLIDPLLGDDEIFERLIEELNKNDMKLILDGVFNHTGCQSKYFDIANVYPDGAYHNPDSPYHNWYFFHPNEGCGYDCWWGEYYLPILNHDDPTLWDYFLGEDGIVRKWIRKGIFGWRLDVAEELRDDFLVQLRISAKEENKDCVIIGEVTGDATRCMSSGISKKLLLGDELDSVINYPLRQVSMDYVLGNIDSKTFRDIIYTLAQHYPRSALYGTMSIIGCHDTERILTVFKKKFDDSRAAMAVKMAATMMYVVPGVPCIYYGDEVGMEGGPDPECRASYPWGRENFDFLNFFRRMNEIYSQNPVLRGGDFSIMDYKGLLVIKRSMGGINILSVFNNFDHDRTYDIHAENVVDIFNNEQVRGNIVLGPLEFMMLRLSPVSDTYARLRA